MADVQIVINREGPLPVSATFRAMGDGPAVVMLSGSVWTEDQDTQIGVSLSVDGTPIGSAWIFANNSNTHMAIVPIVIPYKFSAGEHTISLNALTGETEADQNDYFMVSILY